MADESIPKELSTVVLLTRDLMLSSSIQGGDAAGGVRLQKTSTPEQCLQVVRAENAIAVVVDLSLGSDCIDELVAALPPETLGRSIAFGPHVHESRLQQARDAGFGTVVSRGQFVSRHQLLLGKLAVTPRDSPG